MFTYPAIDPVAFWLGPLPVRWYGLMYVCSFLSVWGLMCWRTANQRDVWPTERISDLIFVLALGVVLGGRLGYVVFYQTADLLSNPLIILKIWQGGMSFHGGLVGVLVAAAYFAHTRKLAYLHVTDFIAPFVPVGLGLGRLGNWINGELWGRPSELPWAVVFPHVDGLARHPSPLYQALGEGVLLFALLWWYSRVERVPGRVSAFFLIAYALIRFLLEWFRQPDAHLGFVALEWLTMGQLLSLPMLGLGLGLMWRSKAKARVRP